METELLAPAKNLETAIQAINCGADAVYIGSVSYGARQNAANSIEDIEKLVNYAHKFYVKVFVTVNTIISDSEIDDVIKLITRLYEIGVDAIIIQDMAIIKAAIDGKIPPIPLHISTQCDNRAEEKVKFFREIGIPRVVLARELSFKQIEKIANQNPDLELECFIHGALCVSYSGQCYLSEYIGGRSANKGQCAQPCRKKYSLINEYGDILIKDKHLLSLKDFNTSDVINKHIKLGVKSFKIEGRLKDELYVKNVVGYYRKLLDKFSKKTSSGKITFGFEPDLNKTFNRGYTHYFLEKRENCFNFDSPKFIGEKIGIVSKIGNNWFEIKYLNKNIVLKAQDGLCFDKDASAGCLVNKVEFNKVYPNNLSGIKIGQNIYRNIDKSFESEVLKQKTKRQIGVYIKYKDSVLKAIDEDNNSVELRLKETDLAKNKEKIKENFMKSLYKTGESDFYVKELEIESELPFISISAINEYRRELLNILMKERLKNYPKEIQGQLKYVDYFNKEIDYRGNVHNNESKDFYKNCNSKIIEPSFESQKPIRQVELMRTKHCIKYALDMCKSKNKLFLADEKGVKYPLFFDCKNCEMAILTPNNK